MELTKIKAFVNGVYDNDKFLKLSLAQKQEDGTYIKWGATIWKNKVNGKDTVAFTQIKKMTSAKKLGSIEAQVEVKQDYNGFKQCVIRSILDHYILTDEQYQAREARVSSWKNKQEQSSVSNQAPAVKQEPKDVPWNLDI